MKPLAEQSSRGFTIISVLITTFIIGTVVVGVFGLFLLSLRLSQEGERRVVAVALANERMEMVRNLPYVDVGTQGGIPSGDILQEEVVTRNSLDYTVKTDIRYVDDEYDGSVIGESEDDDQVTICHQPGTPAENTLVVSSSALQAHLAHGDTQGACGSEGEGSGSGDEYNLDYKQVRVEVSWNSPNEVSPILLITYVVPQGIEGGELGGTLDFQALNASGQGVSGASVQIINDETDPAIDITTQTNEEGRVVLPGLPDASDSYQLIVTNGGYTSEQTYDETATFIPATEYSHLSMIITEVTSKTFFIDQVASLDISMNDDEEAAVAGVDFTLQGTKTIGVDDNADPVYLYDGSGITDSLGQASFSDLVWDAYNLVVDGDITGYDIKETSLVLPITINPADELTLDVVLVDHTPISLHVTIIDAEGAPLDNGTIQVTGAGGAYDETLITGEYGQVLFEDMPSNGEYTVSVDAPGYDVVNQAVDVDDTTRVKIELTPST